MLRITLKPSPCLGLTLAGAHVAAALLLFPLELGDWAKLGLWALIAASLVHGLLRHALLRTTTALTAIELCENDSANVKTINGDWRQARILPTTYVSPLLTIINVRVRQRIVVGHMVIAPDSLDADDFRRLRVWLRWKYRREE